MLSPGCVAWIEQMPAPASVTVAPDTVQTDEVVEAKLTGSPEEAVALTVNGALPKARLERPPNVIVWVPVATWKL